MPLTEAGMEIHKANLTNPLLGELLNKILHQTEIAYYGLD